MGRHRAGEKRPERRRSKAREEMGGTTPRALRASKALAARTAHKQGVKDRSLGYLVADMYEIICCINYGEF